MRGSIGLPTFRQRSTGSIERGSANNLAASIEKPGIRAVRMMRRESLGFQHEQKRRRVEQLLRELGLTRERARPVRRLEAAAVGKLRPASRNTWVRSKQSFSPPRKATPQKNLKSCEM
jgi:hypothetical protein